MSDLFLRAVTCGFSVAGPLSLVGFMILQDSLFPIEWGKPHTKELRFFPTVALLYVVLEVLITLLLVVLDLINGGKLLKIEVIDHLIIGAPAFVAPGSRGWVSLRELGYFYS